MGAVGPEGQVGAGQEPVVGRVFEQVGGGHGGGGEAVHEYGFELPLDEVRRHEDEGERLEGCRTARRGCGWEEGVEDWVDDEGP